MSETLVSTTEEREASHGSKMIELKIRFWTNDIAEEAGKIIPKNAWDSGYIQIKANPDHGIAITEDRVFFGSIADISPRVEEVLGKNGIKLRRSLRDRLYVD